MDRVWPRGMTKARLRADKWLKTVAPSKELRVWFNHDPYKWNEFKKKYFLELDRNAEEVAPLMALAKNEPVTLLYSAKDTDHNQAVALKEYLFAKLKSE